VDRLTFNGTIIETGTDSYRLAHTIAQQKLQRLSPREYDVMLAVAQGKANAQIASELFMSLATVKAHISHILTKLELGNRTQIALLAHDAGLA